MVVGISFPTVVYQSQQTVPSDQSEQSRPITTDWTIWPIRAE